MKNAIFLLLCTACLLVSCIDKFKPRKELKTECPIGIEPVKKILFIGWDGVRSDALLAANTPNLDSLISSSIYSYNVDRGPHTVSVPGWSTILHGVWPAKHGLTENSFKKNNYEEYPDILSILRNHNSDYGLATLSNWDGFLQITSNETYAQRFDTDPEMLTDAISVLNQCTPDVTLLHFDYPDHTGHAFGFDPTSPEYLASIEISDFYLGKIMTEIQIRESVFNESWMVVLTTDHGGNGTGHGGQDDLPETRKVWYVVRMPNYQSVHIMESKSVDLLPTMLKWVNCPYNNLNLDGGPLF